MTLNIKDYIILNMSRGDIGNRSKQYEVNNEHAQNNNNRDEEDSDYVDINLNQSNLKN